MPSDYTCNKMFDVNLTAELQVFFKSMDLDYSLDRVLSLSCEKSFILPELHSIGFRKLYGLSDMKGVYDLFCNTVIRYVRGQAKDTHFPDNFFRLVICPVETISLEILREIGRILADDAYVAILYKNSSKSNPPLPWKEVITSEKEIGSIDEIEKKNFGKNLIAIHKFKKKGKPNAVGLQRLYIKSYSNKDGGISRHVEILRSRIEKEFMIVTQLIDSDSPEGETILIEHHPGLVTEKELMADVRKMLIKKNKVIIEIHSILKFPGETIDFLQNNTELLYRSNENAKQDGATKYTLFPVVAYSHIKSVPKEVEGPKLCTFGYPFRHKGLDEIIDLSKREKIPLEMYLSINNETNSNAEVTKSELQRLSEKASGNIQIFTDFFNDDQLAERLSACSHIIFGNKGGFDASGTMQFAKRIGKPIIAIDSMQSRMAQVYRFPFFSSKKLAFKRELSLLMRSLYSLKTFRGHLLKPSTIFFDFSSSFLQILTGKRLTREILNRLKDPTREEDGLEYLISILRR